MYVACGIVGWILTWFLWGWNYENLMCMEILLVCVGLIFMGMEIFFVGIIFMGIENFLCWTYVWVIIEWIYGDEVFLGWLGYCLDIMEFEYVEWHLGFG